MRHVTRALLTAFLLLACGALAVAAEPVKLMIELPTDVKSIGPGEQVAVQVVGIDADSRRTGPRGRSREFVVKTSAGTITKVEWPYRFQLTAPAQLVGVRQIVIRAHWSADANVRGEVSLPVKAAASDPGGKRKPVKRPRVEKPPTDSPRPGQGDRPLPLPGGEKKPDPQPKDDAPEPKPAEDARKGKAKGDSKSTVKSASGNLKFTVWRTRETAEPTFTNSRRLPATATQFVAPAAYQKLRMVIERDDVDDVSLTWWIGDKQGAKVHKVKSGKDGALRLQRNKAGRLVVHLEQHVAHEKKPVHLKLKLHLDDGKVIAEEFEMRRGKDRDRDGAKDGKQR